MTEASQSRWMCLDRSEGSVVLARQLHVELSGHGCYYYYYYYLYLFIFYFFIIIIIIIIKML